MSPNFNWENGFRVLSPKDQRDHPDFHQRQKQKQISVKVWGCSRANSRDGTIHLPPDSILSRYLGADTICIAFFFFFTNFDSTSIAIRYCYVMRFLFLTLDHVKKLNDTLNIQTVTIKTHLSSHYCDSILQFIVIFLCLLKTRQWKIVDYTLKRDCIWWVILTKTRHHIFLNFYFRSIHIQKFKYIIILNIFNMYI